MRQVIALEIVGLKTLDCDLYNENGKIVYEKGTELTPEIYMMLNHTKIFKRDEEPLTIEKAKKQEAQKKPAEKPEDDETSSSKNKRGAFNELHEKELSDSKRDAFNELHEKELSDSKRDAFNELHEKESADPKRSAFNELHEKDLSDPKNRREGFNELHEKELTDPKRSAFNELHEKELSDPKKRREGFNELHEKKKAQQSGKVPDNPGLQEEKRQLQQQANIAPAANSKKSGTNVSVQRIERVVPEKQAVAKAVSSIKQLEPKNIAKEYKSVIDEDRKQVLLSGIQDVLYGAINSMPLNLTPCLAATESILNEVYDKFETVNNFNELRIHDYYTFAHSLNVAILSAILGRELGFNENKVKDLTFSAFLHDVGKMQIPRDLLYKPGKLSSEEFNLLKKHPELGYNFIFQKLRLPEEIARPALEHHEKWEGQGYPRGLKGKEMSEFSQIIAIADVYDALVSDKVYREAIPAVDAMRIMLTEESRSFNPRFLNKFVYMGVVNSELPF